MIFFQTAASELPEAPKPTAAAVAPAAVPDTSEGLALNQQLYYAKKCWKPSVGEPCLITKRGDTEGRIFLVRDVKLVDPSHVPNGLVVECVSDGPFYGYCVFCFGALQSHKRVVCVDCANKFI